MRTKRRFRRRAAPRLPDSAVPTAPGEHPWQVYVLCDAERKRFSISMARDPIARCYRHRQGVRTPDEPKRKTPHLVLVEPFQCRHTAYARMQRMRLWRLAELRGFISERNPGWDDLYTDPLGEPA